MSTKWSPTTLTSLERSRSFTRSSEPCRILYLRNCISILQATPVRLCEPCNGSSAHTVDQYLDSEWVFMVFLSKVCESIFHRVTSTAKLSRPLAQLKDPHARSFTHLELRTAMMETIAFVNKLSKDAGIVGFMSYFGSSVVANENCEPDIPSLVELCGI